MLNNRLKLSDTFTGFNKCKADLRAGKYVKWADKVSDSYTKEKMPIFNLFV